MNIVLIGIIGLTLILSGCVEEEQITRERYISSDYSIQVSVDTKEDYSAHTWVYFRECDYVDIDYDTNRVWVFCSGQPEEGLVHSYSEYVTESILEEKFVSNWYEYLSGQCKMHVLSPDFCWDLVDAFSKEGNGKE